MTVPGNEVAAELRAHLRRTVEALCEVRGVAVGWAARSAELGLVYTLNQLHVTSLCAPEEALAAADAHQSALSYRHLVVDPPEVATLLSARLDGWKVDREVLMTLARGPARPVGTSRVVELDEDEAASLMRCWVVEDQLDVIPGAVDQLVEYGRREGRAWHERLLGVRDPDGVPVASTKLRSDGAGTAWVEDVYTLPGHRRRGHARALVTYAVDAARAEGHRLVFIVADDEDWPKELYADVGFRPVALRWIFHLDLGAGG